MKVLLLSNYVNDAQESMQRFASLMADGLSKDGHEVRMICPRSTFGRLRPSGEGLGKWLGYVDKFGLFVPFLKASARWADIVHICDHSNAFYTKHLTSVPHVVTCHDLIAVRSALGDMRDAKTRWTGRQLQRMILDGLTQSHHVVCVSEATRNDLLRITGVAEKAVSRIYNALNYPYSPMSKQESATRLERLSIDTNTPFLLSVGGNQWYKNRLGVLRIFDCLKKQFSHLKLIMVGKPWTAEMRRYVLEAGLGDTTVELNGITNEDLRALYSTAAMLLFPSLQEGFGWPIIEAQSCGCPVLTSDRSPMDEVGGEAAIYVNPEDPELAAQAIRRVLENAPNIRESGLRNAARFNVAGMIDSYVTVYGKIRDEARHALKSVRANRRSAYVPLQ